MSRQRRWFLRPLGVPMPNYSVDESRVMEVLGIEPRASGWIADRAPNLAPPHATTHKLYFGPTPQN